MGTMHPKIQDCLSLICIAQKRLSSILRLLSLGGKLEMVNVVLSSLPSYYMSIIKLPSGAINQINKFRRTYLWKGLELSSSKPSLASWKMIQRPKAMGGLGIINLKHQNDALLLKHLYNFYNKDSIPQINLVWEKYYSNGNISMRLNRISPWCKKILSLNSLFKDIARVTLGQDHFNLPLSEQAYEQLDNLISLSNVVDNKGIIKDSWSFSWGSHLFSVKKTYKRIMGSKSAHIIIKWLWRSSTQLKHKVFFWLLFNNRLNRRELLQKKNFILDSYDCEMCIWQKMEYAGHLFFRYSFARRCRAKLHIIYSLHINIRQAIVDIKAKLSIPFAMDIIILMTRAI